jgi:general secretion pathway protein H
MTTCGRRDDIVLRATGACRPPWVAPSGFSLIEVLVALAVLGLVAAAAAVALSAAVERERFRTAAREIAAALRSARQSALAKHAETTFTLDLERKTYLIDGAADRSLDAPKDSVLTLITASTERREEAKGSIRFFSDGSSTGGSVTITFRNRRERIAVDWLTGRVEVGDAR